MLVKTIGESYYFYNISSLQAEEIDEAFALESGMTKYTIEEIKRPLLNCLSNFDTNKNIIKKELELEISCNNEGNKKIKSYILRGKLWFNHCPSLIEIVIELYSDY